MNNKIDINKKILIGSIGIIGLIILIIGSVIFINNIKKQATNNDGGIDEPVQELYPDIFNNTKDKTNYTLKLEINISEKSGIEYEFLIDNNYQKIKERTYTEESSVLSDFFVDYENNDLYYISELGNTKNELEDIPNVKFLFSGLEHCTDRNKDNNTYTCQINHQDAENYIYTMLSKLQEFNIDLNTMKDDIMVTTVIDNELISNITFNIGTIKFNYVFSNYDSSDKLSLPDVKEQIQFGDENGIVTATDDE